MSRLPEVGFSATPEVRPAAARQRGSRWLQLAAYGLMVCVSAVILQPAHAGQVNWSVGLVSPGAVVSVGNQPPVYYAPPVAYAPPVYYAPPVVYTPPRVAYSPPPQVVYRPPVVVRDWDDDRRPHWRRHHHHHDDRGWDRRDRDGRYGY
ncbi:hypothetical protein [Hydrogenophaga soli]